MYLKGSIIETGIDKLVNLVKERGRISLEDAAKELRQSTTVVQEWVDFLEDEGIISVEYKLTKPYLVERKLFDKEKYSILAKAYKEFVETVLEQITIDSLKAELNLEFSALNQELQSLRKEEAILQNSFSKFFESVIKKIKLQLGYEETEMIFKNAYNRLKEKYSNFAFMHILKSVPRGILEIERFDILTKEELEKTARKLKEIEMMKSEFTNIAAHELRTPLVPIIGFIERLLKNTRKFKLAKEVQKNLKICLKNAKRLNFLIEDILAISKLESGEMKFDMKIVDLKSIINNVRTDLLLLSKRKKLSLNLELPSILPNVEGDEQRITQALTNLVDNAIKFTNKGSITISAKRKNDKVIIQVKDQGIGIAKEYIPRLFDKYYQVKLSPAKQSGSGLGLAICKEIVQKHNGNIWVESELGKGSSFYFTLPIKRVLK